jgi:tetratricopeptide (TPR) repeat protein
MVVWNRVSEACGPRMSHFRIRVLDTSRCGVFEQFFVKPPEPTREVRFRASVTTSEADGNHRLALRLVRNPRQGRTARYRVSVTSDTQDLSLEDKWAGAHTISDPWARLAAAYHVLADRPARDALLKRHPAAAAGIGDLYAASQDWGRAIAEYSKASAANPKDTALALRVAVLQAWFAQEKELATTRRRILANARGTNDMVTADCAAKACSIRAATDKAELEAALALARTAVKLDRNREWNLLALGMAEHRSGHDAAAGEALLDAAKAGPNNAYVTGTSAFYRAMSLFRQGKRDEARKVAAAARGLMKPLPSDENNPLPGNGRHDDLILWLAYKEAKDMIQFDEAPLPKAKTNKT